MKKKHLLSVLSTMLLLSCAGGGIFDDGEDDYVEPERDASGNTILKIIFHVDKSSEEGKAYKRRVDAFNAAYKERKIQASPIFKARTQGGTDYETDLNKYVSDGNLPDIITFDAPKCANYADSGILYDISSLFTEEELDDFLSLNKYQGKLYGLPIQESSAGFFYNKQMFRDAGINVEGISVTNPWTFDEFKEACRKLQNIGKIPVDMRFTSTVDETAPYLLYPFVYATGGDFVSSDGMTAQGIFNSEASKKAYRFFKSLVTAGYTSYDITKESTQFFNKEIGMYLSSGWTIPDIDHKYNKEFPSRDDWGLLPYPKDVAKASPTGSWCYGMTNNGIRDKAPALELLKWMSSAESTSHVTASTGMIPARKSCETNYQAGSPEALLKEQLTETGKERPVTVGYPQFSTAFNSVIYKLRNGDPDAIVDAEAANLQAELDRIARNR